MKRFTLLVVFVILACSSALFAQDKPVSPSFIGVGVYHGLSKPLRDIPAMTADEYQKMEQDAMKPRNEDLQNRSYPYAAFAEPRGADPAWQKKMGITKSLKSASVKFSGQTSPYYPSDANGTVGPNHFMQTINTVYAIYNKDGTLAAGPTNMNLLFANVTGSACNDGDPVILYDEQADRWVAIEFSICGSNDYMLFAVSQTNNPLGAWYRYSFDVDDMPDYEKVGIWQDGYYMGTNNGSKRKKDIYVFQRSQMLSGLTPQMVGFDNPYRPTTIDGFMCVPPVDNDGAYAPAGSPGMFITMNDDAIGGGTDQLWLYELAVNWTTPSSSTFNRVQQINVPVFDSNFGNNWDNISQPNTTRELDAIPQVIMNAPQYRNFGSYQTLVCCHTVDVDNTDHAGVRWYELRKTTGAWTLRQSGTYAPDANSRWMGSIRLNGQNEIGLGYSISSSTVFPGIRYTGQSATAYAASTGILDLAEQTVVQANTSQTAYNRWGDYSGMSVDPTDDKTFWFTTQYGGNRDTKICSFLVGAAPLQPDLTTQNPFLSSGSVMDGATVTASVTVKNQGNADATSSTLKYYLSTDNTLDAGDIFLVSDVVSAITSGSTVNLSKILTIPLNTTPGTYNMLFFADANQQVTESVETNNVGSIEFTVISHISLPDLTVVNSSGSASVEVGQNISVSCTVLNQSAGSAGISNLKYYLSNDAAFDNGDTYLATDIVIALASNASQNFSNRTLTIPSTTSSGTKYIIFFADADAKVAESNENNNVNFIAFTVNNPLTGCTSNTQFPSNTLTPNTNWKSQKSIYAGEYTAFNVTAGRVYTFSYCSADGATASFDSELTLRNQAGNSALAYSDNDCDDDARIVWTATFTGVVNLITTVSGCGTNTISATLRYKYSAGKEAESKVEETPEYLVYPNPTAGILYVEATSGFENVKQIAVFNGAGKLVKKIELSTKPDNVYGIDLSGQKPGYYLVKLIGGKEQRFKVLLNK